MDREQRIQYIRQRLQSAEGPVKGCDLAEACQVTRQIIVGDIAHLRMEGLDVLSSPRGYRLAAPKPAGVKALVPSLLDIAQLRDELYTIVDLGGAVLNLTVEHGFYGYLRLDADLHTRSDVDRYLSELRRKRSTALSNLTDNLHRFFVETKTSEAMKAIRGALHRLDEKCQAV